MLQELLRQKEYTDLLTMNDGTPVTPDRWPERRAELLHALCEHSYGHSPAPVVTTRGEVTFCDEQAYAGKVIQQRITLTFSTDRGEFSFPIELFIPKKSEKVPVLLHLAFRPVPDRYIPVEEITDNGFALAVMVYTNVVNDRGFGDYSDGLAAYFGTTSERRPNEWGKLGMWAFGGSRVMDYLLTRDELDGERVAVIGHSRLGKTALWCAALDERIACAVSNNSGYGGAASSKHGKGERVRDFIALGSWDWYCEDFKSYEHAEDDKPYDQSFLLAMIAPRLLLVNSAKEDRGADPEAELLTSLHASSVWTLLGQKGLVADGHTAGNVCRLFEGNVGYHLRNGRHFLSREDWGAAMEFLARKGWTCTD